MYCMNCGTQLPDGSRFCFSCGKSLSDENMQHTEAAKEKEGTQITAAKCTSCGAILELEEGQKVTVCPYCNSTYVVEMENSDAENAKGTAANIFGETAANLLERAKDFEDQEEYEFALGYYNRVLDIDVNLQEAQEGIARVREAMNNCIYFQTNANILFNTGKLQLKKGFLVFKAKKGTETIYELNEIHNARKNMSSLGFMYGTKIGEQIIGCSRAEEWVGIISRAKNGIYPKAIGKGLGPFEKYMVSNFEKSEMTQAIKFYRQQTGASMAEAKAKVAELLR